MENTRIRPIAVLLGVASFAVWFYASGIVTAHRPLLVFYFLPILAALSICGKHCSSAQGYFSGFISVVILTLEWLLIIFSARIIFRRIRSRF